MVFKGYKKHALEIRKREEKLYMKKMFPFYVSSRAMATTILIIFCTERSKIQH